MIKTAPKGKFAENFSANFRFLRENCEINKSRLAAQLGISRMQMYRYEIGENFPPVDQLEKICKFFGLSVFDLLERNIEQLSA